MKGFERINQYIYHLSLGDAARGGGITLVVGKTRFLIDCGASDSAVTDCLVPALKEIGYGIKNIDYVLFTHCHPENMGGAHKLRSILSSTSRVLAYGSQADKLKNPTHYLARACNLYPDYELPFREIRGILPDESVSRENIIFDELYPVAAPGHDDDCVCWYHIETQTLITGDAVQGDGTPETGIAYYNNLKSYKSTLKELSSHFDISTMVCSRPYFNGADVIRGSDGCTAALQQSYDCIDGYQRFVDAYIKSNKLKRDRVSVADMAKSYFDGREKPDSLAYSMITLSQHI